MDSLELFLRAHAVVHSDRVAPAEGGWRMLGAVVDKASEEDLRATPLGANSIAWSLWHIARIEDVAANVVIAAGPQVLDSGGFAGRLGVARRDIGVEMSREDMARFSRDVDLDVLAEYRDAVGRRTREVVAALAPERWDEVYGPAHSARVAEAGAFIPAAAWLDEFWMGKTLAWFVYWVCLEHSVMHLAYCRSARRLARRQGA